MIIDYSILTLVGIIVGGFVVGMKWYLQYREKMEKQAVKYETEQKKPENQIQSLIENLPAILDDRRKLYLEACKSPDGANGALAKSLKQQIDLLSMVESVPEPILNMAVPVLQKVMGAIGKFKL